VTVPCAKRLIYVLLQVGGRTVRVRPLPIGIPFDRFVQMAQEAPQVVICSNQKLILGVDRLDYTKGLVHRLKAYERLLEKYPDHKEKVSTEMDDSDTGICN